MKTPKKHKMLSLLPIMLMLILATGVIVEAKVKTLPIKVIKEADTEKFWNTVENRKGTILVSWCTGTVTNKKKDGAIDGFKKGHNYISYRGTKGVRKGSKVMTVFIWNPDNDYCDDMIGRFDFVIDY